MTLANVTQTVTQKMAHATDSIGATVKFIFTGGEGVIHLDGTIHPGAVSNEDKPADCTVEVELSDFNSMLSGELNPMSAFMGGKMRIDGDMSVAMKLSSIFG